jgi:2-polyprenyl-6-hydroxyphenyl methylase/3-demethylubiquinone-9 3-methyltransferase
MIKTLRWRTAQFFEARWWKKYLADKDVDTYLHNKKLYWNGILQRITPALKLEAAHSILDAGCGPAGIFIVLPDYYVTAVDPLLNTYEETLPHFRQSMYPYVSFHNQPLETFTSSGSYDIVFCLNAINHVSQLQHAFSILYEAATTGGRLVVSIDAHNYKIFKYIFRFQPADILHPHQYDLVEYMKMLTSMGCTILQTECIKKGFFFNHYIIVATKN